MIDAEILAFSAVAAVLAITPGADTLLVIRNAAAGGRAYGAATTAGICSGLFVHAGASALGLSVVLMQSTLAFQALKVAGACYLVWLGAQSVGHAWREPLSGGSVGRCAGRGVRGPRRGFREGLLTNVLNPKVAIFYLAFLPQFIAPGDPVPIKSLLLAGIHFTLSLSWLGTLVVALHGARRVLMRARVRRALQAFSGAVLIGLGIRLAFVER